MGTRVADEQIAALARRQHGAFSRAQAIAAGLDHDSIAHRVRIGRWRRLQRGVYAEAGTPDGWMLRASAVLLAVGGEVALARQSAARLLGLRSWHEDERLHIVVHSRRARGLTGTTVHRTQTLKPHHVTVEQGLRVTTSARTLVDLAVRLPEPRVRESISDAVRRQVVTPPQLRTVVAEVGRLRGVAAVKRVLDELAPAEDAASSELESRFLRLVTHAGLPPDALNHPVVDVTGRRRYLDAVYVDAGVAVELDGAAYHSLATDRHDDLVRANHLALAGYATILRFTWWDVTRRPDYVLATLRTALLTPSGGRLPQTRLT